MRKILPLIALGMLLSSGIVSAPLAADPGQTDAQGCHLHQETKRRHCHDVVPDPNAPKQQAPTGIYFNNCAEARAAGRAPIYRGQPGYRPALDRDNDGVACEPYRGR